MQMANSYAAAGYSPHYGLPGMRGPRNFLGSVREVHLQAAIELLASMAYSCLDVSGMLFLGTTTSFLR